ncbi:alpha/beta hydrolase-fold protein [Clostridium beijerinckii]|uniref:alpha/beta hydrolase n=1 Tax=Clostridium beijerinckii TaxID=1520 RepID=UPI00156D5772|nr:alpha/beta hydrolase-fold protein [Clostridium beijerinckii]NRT35761.1 enterochelin esterase family protein [Clostridium beijerinckii]NRT44811.1 enterochelin esterase family protein [Clostridium beijerinckii]NRZ21195.1 enterochelin esterase family protein [Clostridium beijerinckii]UYZ38395.1 alpha/beta hydrolase-fold protein [Clostridium beijerinckii]
MTKCNVETELIKKLKLNIQNDEKKALNEFLEFLKKKGNPIIEPIIDETDYSLVTIFHFAEQPINNVLMISRILPALTDENIEEHLLNRISDTNLWYGTYKVRNDIKFSYNLFPNDSLIIGCQERYKNMIADKFNKNKLTFDRPGCFMVETPYVNMPNSEENFWLEERINIPKGTIIKLEFESSYFIKPRVINIYKPYGYSRDSQPYGFIALTDGYDYINVLKAEQALNNLIDDKKIPPIVAIFIDTIDKRSEDLSCNDLFCSSVANEMIPWIRERYNLSEDPQNAIIGGSSLGGLTATYMGLKHSEVFGNVLCQSGSFWYKPTKSDEKKKCKVELEKKSSELDCWMSRQIKLSPKLPLKFYMNIGVLENKQRMINNSLNVKNTLESLGYHVDFEFFKSGHDYLSWGQTLATGLISLIGYQDDKE